MNYRAMTTRCRRLVVALCGRHRWSTPWRWSGGDARTNPARYRTPRRSTHSLPFTTSLPCCFAQAVSTVQQALCVLWSPCYVVGVAGHEFTATRRRGRHWYSG